MADDWQVGDLALCIIAKPWVGMTTGHIYEGPKKGSIHRVEVIAPIGGGSVGFELEGVPTPKAPDGGPVRWNSIRFRKIRPLSDEERASFMADLDEPAGQPKRVPATTTMISGVK